MKQYLIDFFNFNHLANHKLLEAIHQLPEKEQAIKLFSHMILAQDKWMNRITKKHDDNLIQWMLPVIPINELGSKWDNSIQSWLKLIHQASENDLQQDLVFKRANDGKFMTIKLTDLILQLNYHCIHHRAQINTLISQQGITPPQTDYIFTKLREL